MASAVNQPPVRAPSGVSSDLPWQPLADCGIGVNPFLYHLHEDDFDYSLFNGVYQKTATGNGGIAIQAGDGGQGAFSTNNSTPLVTDIASIQLPFASFSLTLGKKLFYLARIQLADLTNPALLLGLIQTTTTPFTVVDGIWISKASGSLQYNLNHSIASVVTTVALPLASFTPLVNTFFDIGFYLNRFGEIVAFAGSQLVGYIPQNGPGFQRGPIARMTPPALSAANLNVTMALQSGTATAKTMIADFQLAAKER